MKKLVLIAAVAALSACNQNKAEPAPAASESAAPAPAPSALPAAADMAGTYEFDYKGKATTSVMKANGTYEDSQDGKVTETGKWAVKDGKTCFADNKGDPDQCWTTTTPDSMGMFTATSVDGKTVLKVTRKKA